MGEERRQAPRTAADRQITVSFPIARAEPGPADGGVFGTIIDLSATGARAVIDPQVQLEVGARVVLALDDQPLAAEIVWRYDMWAGLRFERPIAIN